MTAFRQVPADLPIEMIAGEDLSVPVTLTADSGSGPTPYPFTGATVAAAVYRMVDIQAGRKNPTPLAVIGAATAGDGNLVITVNDTVSGSTLGPGTYAWACESTVADQTRVIVSGEFLVSPKVP